MRTTCWLHFVGSVGLCLVLANASSATYAKDLQTEEYYELMKLFVDSFEQIERNYVQERDPRELIEAAVNGMVNQLDPYSSYIQPKELQQFNSVVEQEFGGIGIHVMVHEPTQQLIVVSPLPGTPAFRAGLRAGDIILEIQEKAVADFPGNKVEGAVQLMRGKPGGKVKIKLVHEGESQPFVTEVDREVIKTPTVLGDRYNADGTWNYLLPKEDKIGYVRLAHFSRNSAEEMHKALDQLHKDGVKGLVLDLRSNPGGLLTAATAICDQFLDEGKIVSTKGRNTEEQVVNARRAGTFPVIPMVILVNHFSASASEIVSACLQDHKRAIVVGERTWGKGSVQNVIKLESGKSALKLTTASYHRPSGKKIHRFPKDDEAAEWGVQPDEGYKVGFTVEDRRAYAKYRSERDVFRPGTEPKESDFRDKQLEKGLEYLRKAAVSGAAKAADNPNRTNDASTEPKAPAELPATTDPKATEPKAKEKVPAPQSSRQLPERRVRTLVLAWELLKEAVWSLSAG